MKDKILFPFRLLYKIWFAIVFLVTGLIQYPFYLILVKLRFTRTIFFIKSWVWLPLFHIFLLVILKTKRPPHFRFPDGPFIICANHTSYLDIMLMYSIIRDRPFIFMGKEELKKFPIIGLFFRTGSLHVAVNRKNKVEASASLKKLGEKIEEGYPVVVFPEGTQSKIAPQLLPFKPGAFKLAIEKQVPIIAMTFLDNWKLFHNPLKANGRARPGISRVIIHNPIETKGMELSELLTLQNKVREMIRQDLVTSGYNINES